MKLVDTLALGASTARCEGSSPFLGTNNKTAHAVSLTFPFIYALIRAVVFFVLIFYFLTEVVCMILDGALPL